MIFLSWYYIVIGVVALVIALKEKSFTGCLVALVFFASALVLNFARGS